MAVPLRASASSARSSLLAERVLLGGRLHLDDVAGAGHDEVRVRVGAGILRIVEIEHRDALVDAARDRRDVIAQRLGLDHVARLHPGEAVGQRDPGAGDRGGARAAVGLDHVAIDGDLPLAQRLEVDDGAQRATDQPLDLQRAAALLARVTPRAGCARASRAAACRIRR